MALLGNFTAMVIIFCFVVGWFFAASGILYGIWNNVLDQAFGNTANVNLLNPISYPQAMGITLFLMIFFSGPTVRMSYEVFVPTSL